MSDKKRIEQEVEKTLDCLDHFRRIQPTASFSERVISKMYNPDRQGRRSFRPGLGSLSLRPALLLILLLLNLISVYFSLRESGPTRHSRGEYIVSLADEYNLNQANFFLNYNDE